MKQVVIISLLLLTMGSRIETRAGVGVLPL